MHPDFIRDKITDRQLHEIAWYYTLYPFGSEIDHLMMARICTSMAGGKPDDYLPKFKQEQTTDDLIANMSGMQDFLLQHDIDHEIEVDDGDY